MMIKVKIRLNIQAMMKLILDNQQPQNKVIKNKTIMSRKIVRINKIHRIIITTKWTTKVLCLKKYKTVLMMKKHKAYLEMRKAFTARRQISNNSSKFKIQ